MNSPAVRQITSEAEEFSRRLRLALLWTIFCCGLFGLVTCGCRGSDKNSKQTATSRQQQTRIVAQGKLEPAQGVIRLTATPGDRIESVEVEVGELVEKDQLLISLRSEKLLKKQLETLEIKYQEAEQHRQAAIDQAQLAVKAAELKSKQAKGQVTALKRQDQLVEMAENQVESARKILERLENLAADSLTKDFVGAIELDRQRIQIADAELKHQQQVDALDQAKETSDLGTQVAEQELSLAQNALRTAQESMALKAFESERAALQMQVDAARVISPCKAVVLSIDSQVGEMATQFPLMELANTDQIVCRVEVYETDAALVKPKQTATISSPVFDKKLRGRVLRREMLVGNPKLSPADPLAKVDYRTVNAIVEIDPEDVQIAAQWLQLQVEVTIDLASQ